MYDFNAVAWLLCSCVVVRGLYVVVHHLLEPASSKYASLERGRQMYVQKNLVKSAYLALLTVYAIWYVVWPAFIDNVWDSVVIHRIAALYVSNDYVGLTFVPNLPKTTRIHHVVTIVFVFASFGLDFQDSDIAQAMFVYTLASASAYLVNFHLAIRWLCKRKQLAWLRHMAGAIYGTCCGISWSWHIWWCWTRDTPTIYHLLYLMLLAWIVWDDIVLMRWLTA